MTLYKENFTIKEFIDKNNNTDSQCSKTMRMENLIEQINDCCLYINGKQISFKNLCDKFIINKEKSVVEISLLDKYKKSVNKDSKIIFLWFDISDNEFSKDFIQDRLYEISYSKPKDSRIILLGDFGEDLFVYKTEDEIKYIKWCWDNMVDSYILGPQYEWGNFAKNIVLEIINPCKEN